MIQDPSSIPTEELDQILSKLEKRIKNLQRKYQFLNEEWNRRTKEKYLSKVAGRDQSHRGKISL